MSRTVRRKNGVKPFWVGTDLDCIDGIYRRYKLCGKDLKKDLSKYHGDHGYGRYTGRCKHGVTREKEGGLKTSFRTEIAKWKKNSDHEIQVPIKKYLKDYWD